MNKIKLIIFFIAACIVGLIFYFSSQHSPSIQTFDIHAVGQPTTVEKNADGLCDKGSISPRSKVYNPDSWMTYHNNTYGYAFSYPDSLCLSIENPAYILGYGTDGMGGISVVASTTSKTLDEWVSHYATADSKVIVEKYTEVAGYKAASVHFVYIPQGYEPKVSATSERTVIFIKDGIAFEIWMRGIDGQDYILQHFKFDK